MKLGYARVSTREQELALQLDDLRNAGCEQIFEKKMTGTTKFRPQLREGDVLVIWKLDRLARSLQDIVALVQHIQEKAQPSRASMTKSIPVVHKANSPFISSQPFPNLNAKLSVNAPKQD